MKKERGVWSKKFVVLDCGLIWVGTYIIKGGGCNDVFVIWAIALSLCFLIRDLYHYCSNDPKQNSILIHTFFRPFNFTL